VRLITAASNFFSSKLRRQLLTALSLRARLVLKGQFEGKHIMKKQLLTVPYVNGQVIE
jgi:hypothetical protein